MLDLDHTKPRVTVGTTAEPTIVETPVQARQGVLGRPVLFVLIISTALAAIAMAFFVFRY